MNDEVIQSLARNIVSGARDQVERSWGENPEAKLGGRLYAGQVAQHVLLALTGYLNVDKLTDAEARRLVIAAWDVLSAKE